MRWLDDLIGKIFALAGTNFPLVGRINFLVGAGGKITGAVVDGDTNTPTTLDLTIGVSDEIAALAATTTAIGASEDPDYELLITLPLSTAELETGYSYRYEVTIDITYSGGDVRAVGVSEVSFWRASDGTLYGLDVFQPPPRALSNANTTYSAEHCEVIAGEFDTGIVSVEIYRDYSAESIPVTARATGRLLSKTALTDDPGLP